MKKIMSFLFVSIVFCALALRPEPVTARECLPLLNALTRPLVKQALSRGQKNVCARIPQYNKTQSVRLLGLKVCLEQGSILLSGSVDVVCGASSSSVVSGSIHEVIDFNGSFDINACRLRDVQVIPRGVTGKILATGLNIQGNLQAKLNRQLAMFCQ